jgi:Transposase DDE domain
MKATSELSRILGQQLHWHKSRLDFFAKALMGLFICKTINFQEIAVTMPDSAEIASRYKRIYRFFALFQIDFEAIARWLFKLFFSPTDKFYISMDRTNWFFGKAKINIFMLSICYEGIAIPLFWQLLDKAGSTNAEEQITLLTRFINTFGKEGIQGVLADREFPNKNLIGWLENNKIPFYFRVKGDAMIYIHRKKFKRADTLFTNLRPYEQQIFPIKVNLYDQSLYLVASKNVRNELMLVVSNANPQTVIACYLRRWEIENLFQALKGRGFPFEDTHVTNLDRINKIIVLLAIGFAWAHKTGEWRGSTTAYTHEAI